MTEPKETAYPAALKLDQPEQLIPLDVFEMGASKEAYGVPLGKVFYKRYFSFGERMAREGKLPKEKVKSTTLQSAKEDAERQRDAYDAAQSAFGTENTAQSLIMIGHPRDTQGEATRDQIVVQGLQENCNPEIIKVLDSLPGKILGKIKTVKETIFKEYADGLPSDFDELKWLLKRNKEALQEFYVSYMEAVLLGYVPDTQYNPGQTLNIGLLFGNNIGFVEREGKKHLVLFDFGNPHINVLSVEARKRLHQLIDEHKKEGYLPIELVRDPEISEGRIVRLAKWYQKALEKELADSSVKESSAGIHPERYLDFLKGTLEFIFLGKSLYLGLTKIKILLMRSLGLKKESIGNVKVFDPITWLMIWR